MLTVSTGKEKILNEKHHRTQSLVNSNDKTRTLVPCKNKLTVFIQSRKVDRAKCYEKLLFRELLGTVPGHHFFFFLLFWFFGVLEGIGGRTSTSLVDCNFFLRRSPLKPLHLS